MTRRNKTPPRGDFPHPLPRELERGRIRLRPTGYGLVFLAVLALMLAGSVRYNNNLGFLLSFLLGSMVDVSCRHTRRNLEGLKIVSCRADEVFAGEPAEFELVADPGATGRCAVTLGFENTEALTIELPVGKRTTLALRSPILRRGVFSPGSLRVVSCYPLGLFSAAALLRPDAACVVYPRPIPGPFDPGRQPGRERERGDGSAGAGSGAEDFQGLKAYEPGDPLQLISWKTLSRGMGLFTKEFVSGAGSAVCLDWFRLPGLEPEKRLGRMCDMVLNAQKSSLVFGMRLPGETIRPGIGPAHGRRCLLELALYDAGGKGQDFRSPTGGG